MGKSKSKPNRTVCVLLSLLITFTLFCGTNSVSSTVAATTTTQSNGTTAHGTSTAIPTTTTTEATSKQNTTASSATSSTVNATQAPSTTNNATEAPSTTDNATVVPSTTNNATEAPPTINITTEAPPTINITTEASLTTNNTTPAPSTTNNTTPAPSTTNNATEAPSTTNNATTNTSSTQAPSTQAPSTTHNQTSQTPGNGTTASPTAPPETTTTDTSPTASSNSSTTTTTTTTTTETGDSSTSTSSSSTTTTVAPSGTQSTGSKENETTTTITTTEAPTTTTDANDCASNPCQHGATCKDEVNSYTCNCKPGFTGTNCETDIDDCACSPCKNGATCNDHVNNYTCACVPGYNGYNCEIDIDDCACNPCKNGATCTDQVNNYTCTCAPGYTGYTCETDIDDCACNPCVNGATCNDQVNNYTCTCAPGYNGYNCETDINDCACNPCENGATCTDHVNNYTCTCAPGYNGYNCETDIDDCVGVVCNNGGTCEDKVNGFVCKCTPAWEGNNCTLDVDECTRGTHECHVRANCTNTEGDYNCTCLAGFEGDGKDCKDIDECDIGTDQCRNNTEFCYNTVGNYRCLCQDGWKGTYCDQDIDECANNPCSVSADCHNTNGSFTCTCDDGYRGDGFQCTEIVLFEIPAGEESHEGDDEDFGPYKIPGGLPYRQKIYYNIYVSINGYISLERSHKQRYPPRNSAAWGQIRLPIIAPLWSDIQMKNTSKLIINKAITNVTVLSKLVNDSNQSLPNPRFGFMATWQKAVPYPYDQNWKFEEADFQAVILTNGSSTLLVFNYDREYFTWDSNPVDKFVSIGISNADFTGNVSFSSSDFTDANKATNTGKKGRWAFSVSESNAVSDSESKCQAWINNADIQNKISSALKASNPCPCSRWQARRDSRFRYSGRTMDGNFVYKSRFTQAPYQNIQQCHYNQWNLGLLQGYPGGGYMVSKDDADLQIEEAFMECCSSSTRLCRMFYNTVPSDSCRRYRPPTWSPLWGDPHITTLDNVQYTFNGRGEYILLKTGNLSVQVRTELAVDNSTDATVFVGLAAKDGESKKVEILLNKTAGNCNVYLDNIQQTGVLNITSEFMTIEGTNGTNNPLTLSFKSGISIQIMASTILDFVTSGPEELMGKTSGLLGNFDGNKTNDFVLQNSTLLAPDSSEQKLFDFGSSWKVLKNESLFNYNPSAGKDYEYYNNATVVPSVFVGDEVKNLSGFLSTKCGGQLNETMVTATCGNNTACIIDTAATCDQAFGIQTKNTQEQEETNRKQIDNNPPVFSMNDTLYIGPDLTAPYSLVLSVEDNNTFSVNVTTTMTNYLYNDTTKEFTWNITQDLKTESVWVKFEATDELSASSTYWPNIYYCGCPTRDQCDYSELLESQSSDDRFYRANCNCPEGTKGDYCEETVDVCSPNPCFNDGPCNNTSTPHCGSCPTGYNGTADGTRCWDVDECRLETDACQQRCNNTIGSYVCDCDTGFMLNQNNHTCDDIDECSSPDLNTCKVYQTCTNLNGSYDCHCLPGFIDKGNNTCEKVHKSFIVLLQITVTKLGDKPSNEDVKNSTRKWLSNEVFKTYNFASIEIILSSHSARRRRAADSEILDVTAVMHTDNTSYTTDKISNTFDDYKTEKGTGSVNLDGITVSVNLDNSKVPSDDEAALCDYPEFATCDPISTVCQVTNGNAQCSCREGFDGWLVPGQSCKDIDECTATPDKCKGGNCTNQPGSYRCTCKNGFIYDGSLQCTDTCLSNPCQNGGECMHGNQEGQYVCKCDDKWAGQNCERENEETSRLTTIIIIVAAVVGGICLILLIALFGVYRRMRSRQSSYSRYAGLSSISDDITYSIPRPAVDKDTPFDDTSTTFTIPRPKLGNTSHEMTDLDAVSNNSNSERYAKSDNQDEDRFPLASASGPSSRNDNFGGRANPSFLHDETSTNQRRSRSGAKSSNNYEYF